MSTEKFSVPGQIFRWFEKMKTNYEQSVDKILSRFEQQSAKQQQRLDDAHNQHLTSLQQAHQAHIQQLQQQVEFYQQQLALQQQSLNQLNSRYDALMALMVANKSELNSLFDDLEIEDVSTELVNHALATKEQTPEDKNTTTTEPTVTKQAETQSTSATTSDDKSEQINIDALYQLAIESRNQGEFTTAIEQFKDCANQNHAMAMGALARAYFKGEGVQIDPAIGLAWLIKAAELGLPQAITKVEKITQQDPELVKLAQLTLDTL